MTFLPIVERQLRESSRRPATYLMRSLLALGSLTIWFFLLIAGNNSGIRKGMMLFIALGVLSLGFCLLAGVFLTADCISEEKREGTLGLLFLTELRGYDVVFGKLVATSLHAFYGLLAVLPLLALPLLMGGVTSGEFWRVTAVLLLTLFLSLSLGMLVSAISRETRQAMSAALLIIIVLSGIFPLVWWIQQAFQSSVTSNFWLWPSPAYLYSRAFDVYWRTSRASEFWYPFFTVFALASGSLISASLYLPRVWHEKGETSKSRGEISWLRRLRFGSRVVRLTKRWLLDLNPFYWLSNRDRLPRLLATSIVGIFFAIWICCFFGCYSSSSRTRDTCFGIVIFMGYGLHQVLKALVAIEASRRLSDDRQSGALELLLVTPLSSSDILSGQRRALQQTYRWPVLVVALTNLCLLLLITGKNPLRMSGTDQVVFLEIFICGAVLLPLDAFALGWIGMSMAMKKRGHHRAIFATLARVMLPPWLAVMIFFFLGIGGIHWSSGDMIVVIGLWFLGCVVVNLVQAGAAANGLPRLLRQRSPRSSIVVPDPALVVSPV